MSSVSEALHLFSEPLLVRDIEGDGNCLFGSSSYTITGEEDQHAVIRSLICDYDGINEKTGDVSMRLDKVWGTTTEILAAAKLFHVNVFVWAKFGPTYSWHVHKLKDIMVNESVYLENKSGLHFNVVLRV